MQHVNPAFGFRGLIAVLLVLCAAPHHPKAAPDQTLGTAVMSARVNFDGGLIDGSGATGSTRTGLGIYEVTFNRDVEACTYVVTPRDFAFVWVGFSNVSGNGNDNGVVVHTAKPDFSDHMDVGFHLVVYCGR